MHYPKSFQQLIEDFSSLPSVGPKMAERLVLHLFKQDPESLIRFSQDLENITTLETCSRCYHICESDLCNICADTKRDTSAICVVEDPLDVISIERTDIYRGTYHVLGGTIEATRNTASENDQLTIQSLLNRVSKEKPKEIILATNPTTEGDLTALYLKRKLSDFDVNITRLARGLSTGGDIEYADEETLSSALTNRRNYA